MLERHSRKKNKVISTTEPILGHHRFELITHAVDQMKIRDISEKDVLRTLSAPDVTGLPTEVGRFRVRWNKTLHLGIDVVYEKLPDRIRVITAIAVKRPRRLVDRKN